MGMHADCGHGIIMATSMAQLHMQAMTVGLEYGLVSLGLHCFLRLERALCWRSGRCLVGDAFSV